MNLKDIAIKDIVLYDNNPRKNEKAIDVVASSIEMFGFKVPVVIDGQNVVVCGHTRVKAALKLGMASVPCVIADDLTDEQAKAFRVADNRTHEFSEWDLDKLQLELSELDALGVDMSSFNFDSMKNDVEEDNFDVDAALNEIEEPQAKQSDIWGLGNHRLVCGDATVCGDVEKLMGGKLAAMVFTDPPYNVDYEGGTKEALKIKNDKMSNDNFYQFLYDAFLNMHTATAQGGAIYICHADSEGLNFRKAMIDSGWMLKQCIIWIKNSIVMGRQDHHWQHEPILYGWKPGGKHAWYGGRKQSTIIKSEDGVFINKVNGGYQVTFNNGVQKVVINVPTYEVVASMGDEATTTWHVDKPLRNGEHPTMKPIKLCARAIKNSSKPGDVVMDLFGGSGSTLMACEQTNRTCYTMELDEKYVDVIIRRWEQHTGKKAELLNV